MNEQWDDSPIRRMEPPDPLLQRAANSIVRESIDGPITPSRAVQLLKNFNAAREAELSHLRDLLMEKEMLTPTTIIFERTPNAE